MARAPAPSPCFPGRRALAQVLQLLRQGAHYASMGTALIPDGSFGNGGAMRIAPLAIAYRCEAAGALQAPSRHARRALGPVGNPRLAGGGSSTGALRSSPPCLALPRPVLRAACRLC